MKRYVYVSFLVLLGFTISSFVVQAQDNQESVNNQNQTQNSNPAEATQLKANIINVLLNDFSSAEDWRAFATSPLYETTTRKIRQVGPIQDVFDPNSLTEEEKLRFVEKENYVLGVKGYFNKKGFDRVEIKPPHEYVITGLGRHLSVWVLSRNYNHTLYVKLRDFRNKIYKLKLGKLNYLGWKKHTVTLPGWLPQSIRYSLLDQNLRFVSLFIVADNYEPIGTYYFYFDELQVKVDRTDLGYPGSQIKDIW